MACIRNLARLPQGQKRGRYLNDPHRIDIYGKPVSVRQGTNGFSGRFNRGSNVACRHVQRNFKQDLVPETIFQFVDEGWRRAQSIYHGQARINTGSPFLGKVSCFVVVRARKGNGY